MDRAQADYMGMLATVMNALAMQNALEQIGVETRVQSAIQMDEVCEPVIRRRAERHLEKGRVVIFAAGVGSPYFTTDSGAALRAAEMKCDALLKGTSVDGVYDADPKKNPRAKRFETVSYDTVLADNLKVMDASAVALVPRQQHPDRGLLHPREGQPRAGPGGRGRADDRAEGRTEHGRSTTRPISSAGCTARSRRSSTTSRACARAAPTTALLDPVHGRGLWRDDAAEPGGDDLGARAAHAQRAGVGQGQRDPGREGHPHGQSRAQPDHRRPDARACRSPT